MPPPVPTSLAGTSVLAEALTGSEPDPSRLLELADQLHAGPAVRRIGSLADRLRLARLADELEPLTPPTWDLELDPGLKDLSGVFRDRKWRVRWPATPDALAREIEQ